VNLLPFSSTFSTGILILDDNGVCLDANPAAFAILGAPPAVLVGHCFDHSSRTRSSFNTDGRCFLEIPITCWPN